MATIKCYSMHDCGEIHASVKDVLVLVKKCERRTFPHTEALDFEVEVRKRNVEVRIYLDDSVVPSDLQLAAYLVFTFSKNGNVVLLHKICVEPTFRTRGIGSMVLSEAITSVQARGGRKLRLWVDEKNTIAMKLYEASGFQMVSSRPDYYGPGRIGISMQLVIDDV